MYPARSRIAIPEASASGGPRLLDRVRAALRMRHYSRKIEKTYVGWCPVEITGLGPRSLRPIAGEDSLQSLVLALEFVTNTTLQRTHFASR